MYKNKIIFYFIFIFFFYFKKLIFYSIFPYSAFITITITPNARSYALVFQ